MFLARYCVAPSGDDGNYHVLDNSMKSMDAMNKPLCSSFYKEVQNSHYRSQRVTERRKVRDRVSPREECSEELDELDNRMSDTTAQSNSQSSHYNRHEKRSSQKMHRSTEDHFLQPIPSQMHNHRRNSIYQHSQRSCSREECSEELDNQMRDTATLRDSQSMHYNRCDHQSS
jgi:hypothetical protein